MRRLFTAVVIGWSFSLLALSLYEYAAWPRRSALSALEIAFLSSVFSLLVPSVVLFSLRWKAPALSPVKTALASSFSWAAFLFLFELLRLDGMHGINLFQPPNLWWLIKRISPSLLLAAGCFSAAFYGMFRRKADPPIGKHQLPSA
jgi:hypothetical protein